MNYKQIISELESSRQAIWSLIEELPPEAYFEPGVMNGWTLKDILAHLCRWEGMCVTFLWKLKQGETPERLEIHNMEQVDRLNALWYEQDKDRALDLILTDFKGLRRQTIRRLETFDAEELADPQAFEGLRGEPLWKWVALDTFEHEQEHVPAIREWLESRD